MGKPRISPRAKYKGEIVAVTREDEGYYYVMATTWYLPDGFMEDVEHWDKGVYTGKIRKPAELEFLE